MKLGFLKAGEVTDWLENSVNKNRALLSGLCLVGLLISSEKSFSSEKSLPQSLDGSMEVRKADEEELKRAIIARGDAFAAGKCEEFESYIAPDVIEIEGGLITPHEVLTKECREETRSQISRSRYLEVLVRCVRRSRPIAISASANRGAVVLGTGLCMFTTGIMLPARR
jgi:hypothetical protein